MYTRSYGGERSALPENYDGTAFSRPESEEYTECREAQTTQASGSGYDVGHCKAGHTGTYRIPFLGNLTSGGIGGFLSSIGTEELLIIGIALFLFLSGDGDTECALMLLFLLFIR